MIRFMTETGSCYDIRATGDGYELRRTPAYSGGTRNALREDGEWVAMLEFPALEVGSAALLLLTGLSGDGGPTRRITTRVTSIEEAA